MSAQRKLFRDVSDEERDKLAGKKQAMPDGGYPIGNGDEGVTDLKNAISSIGRAKDRSGTIAHIKHNAKRLGREDLIPEEWCVSGKMHVIFGTSALAYEAEVTPEPELVVVAGKEYFRGKPIHIFPFGEWHAVDGRLISFTKQDAEVLMANANGRRNDLAVTFDHEKHKSESGGWMQDFEAREDGLWATDVKWTKGFYAPDGKTYIPGGYDLIKSGAFRYLSGDAFGLGDGTEDAPFHPRRLLAASLVPKPALDGLREVTLSAQAQAEKEKQMDKVLIEKARKRFKLGADATDEAVREHLEKALEAQDADDKEDGDKNDAAEKVKKHAEKLAARDGEHKPTCDDEECDGCKGGSEKMSAKEITDAAAKAAKEAASVAVKVAVEGATEGIRAVAKTDAEKLVQERFAAEKKAADVEAELLSAEKDGKLVPAERESFRHQLMSVDEKTSTFAREQLKARAPKAPTDRLPESTFSVIGSNGGGADQLKEMLFHSDGEPKYRETAQFYTQVARFAAYKNIPLDAAKSAVMRGENMELEAQLKKANGRTAEDFTGGGIGEFRPSSRQLSVDPDMVKFIKERIRNGRIPEAIVPANVQQFASISDFQPAARTTLPMALGYYQAEFVGDEALPVFVGGADEKAAWPEFAFEKFAAVAAAAALLGPPTRTSLNVTWHTVTVEKYPIQIDIDRRARAASVTLPRGIDTIAMENIKAQVGVTKEVAQHALLAATGNYSTAAWYPTIGTSWNSAGNPASYSGVPITDVSLGMSVVRGGVRAWPDLLLLSPNAALGMRKNQQIIDTVRYTGTMERPGTMVSDATLAAIFGGIFNVSIVVGGAGYSSLPSGASPTDVWGNDAWLVCTGQGMIEAPRFGMTVTAAGSPRVRAFPNELLGADGSDSIVLTDSWKVVAVNNKAAYWMINAGA